MNPQVLLYLIVLFLIEDSLQQTNFLMSLNTTCCSWTLTREAILSLRDASAKPDHSTRLFITSLGCASRRRGRRGGREKRADARENLGIPVIIGKQRKPKLGTNTQRPSMLITVDTFRSVVAEKRYGNQHTPSLFVLNAAAITKPHAVEHLAADLLSYKSDIAIITETHCKQKHQDSILNIPGYALCRRDRLRRRGGGVAVYVRSALSSTVWTYSADDRTYELHWQRVGELFIGALYHPPRPTYATDALLNYIEAAVDELNREFPAASIVLAGDLNQLTDHDVAERTGLAQIVHQPTRGQNILDRIFVSQPMYSTVRIVKSVMSSDHSAIVAYAMPPSLTNKISTVKTYRSSTPAQHAQFMLYLSREGFVYSDSNSSSADTQAEFDAFYDAALQLLNRFYPARSITVSSRDPSYITPAIKAKLRRKNRLYRAGRIDEANALAQRIGKDITSRNRTRLSRITAKTGVKDMWKAVRQLTGRKQDGVVEGITAETLNRHYANISTDHSYQQPPYKLTASRPESVIITELQLFQILDKLSPTATGIDNLPAWFLRLGAPAFCKPLAYLFNKSLATSVVPRQWKQASIRPVPKTATPLNHSDYRPISITSVLSRTLERIVVREFLYPAIIDPPTQLSFGDQFAFRPTGSTTAALIALMQSVTDMLATNPFVSLIALDFSKAFDTVRHDTLLSKMALLNIPDSIYNWLVNFFQGHEHCTKYGMSTSNLLQISASIIQGSAIGPVSYDINASDLSTVTPGNLMYKYADDTYLVIPASNIHFRATELNHVADWAGTNNLKLNKSKSVEIILRDRKRKQQIPDPPKLPDIQREVQVKILGITITNHLSVSEHVRDVISKCGQTMYALKVLRSHGMSDIALNDIFRSVVIAKLLYASPAWWGFATSSDKQRIQAFVRRGVRLQYYGTADPTPTQLAEQYDETLFNNIMHNRQHVLYSFLPELNSHQHSLRPRRHNFSLSVKTDDRNFLVRQLFSDSY